MNRRRFLGLVGFGVSHTLGLAKVNATLGPGSPTAATRIASGSKARESKAYGSGYFGEWITDQFGLPAYRYTCNQVADSRALSPVHQHWRAPADHTHQVGNDRLIAAVSNYGYVQVRQDEGSPKFLTTIPLNITTMVLVSDSSPMGMRYLAPITPDTPSPSRES